MARTTLLPTTTTTTTTTKTNMTTPEHSNHRHHRNINNQHQHQHKRKKKPPQTPPPQPQQHNNHNKNISTTTAKTKKPTPTNPAPTSSWEQLKNMLSCRSAAAAARVHDPTAAARSANGIMSRNSAACGASLCALRDVVDAASTAASSAVSETAPLTRPSRRALQQNAGGARHQPAGLRGLSGCYECRAINVEPMSRRYPRPRELCSCTQCGEVFTKADSLEHHQAICHAVSELGPDDSGRNIVEIIFKSSWLKRDHPICQIERILKVHNPQRTIARFEAYRDTVKSRARAVTARAAADGNELLRFHSATLGCSLGLHGATSLCSASNPNTTTIIPTTTCGICTAIRHGFAPMLNAHPLGVRTTASSGRAHDCGTPAPPGSVGRRAMLVCRVIAGRVRRTGDTTTDEHFDSVAEDGATGGGMYGNLEELFVANPRAILPCFVVIYRSLD